MTRAKLIGHIPADARHMPSSTARRPPAEPHKRRAVAAVTVAAGYHVAPAAPGDWQVVVRGHGRAARRQAAAATARGGPM
eukprot:4053214-Prymnesium_polylepis.1